MEMTTEATPLLRFAYATLAMRRGWENQGAMVEVANGCSGDYAPVPVPVVVHAETQRHSELLHLPTKEADSEDVVGLFLPVLEVVLSAQMTVADGGDLDGAIVGVLGEMCELARSAGAFADMVNVLITMLLDVSSAADEELLRGVSGILLLLCFESRASVVDTELAFAPTIYVDDVLAQIHGTLSTLFEVAAADALAAHAGVRCLADTHADIVSHFEALRHYGGSIV